MYGQKIKAKRRALHMSQEDLAKKLNLTRQAISKGEYKKPDEESPAAGIFWWMLYSIIGFVFFALYYFAIMESVLKLNPKEIPIFSSPFT